jgi:maleate isomerase/arylmalonate decarboxylase
MTSATLPAIDWPDHSTYGWRARLGLIVPPTNTTNEAEWSRMLPDGVTLHTTRMPLHLHVAEPLTEDDPLARDLIGASALLAQAGVSAIAYGCTAGSMIEPLDQLPAHIERTTSIPGTTTAKALVDALHAIDAKRIVMISPYGETLEAREVAFLEKQGFTIVSARGLGIGEGGAHEFVRIRTLGPAVVVALARAAMVNDADAMLIACTDFGTLPVVDILEADLGIPIVTSNQAQLWATLHAASVHEPITGWGRLLDGTYPPSTHRT